MTTAREASHSLYEAGPGGICDDCGHFAMRHVNTDKCLFPREIGKECQCKGMLWLGHRIDMGDDNVPVLT
jgi:hypothetical protein